MRGTSILAFLALVIALGGAARSSAEDCDWCWNTHYQILGWYHEFLGPGLGGDLQCQGDGAGCHMYQKANTCDEEHAGCQSPPWVKLFDEKDPTRALLAIVESGDGTALRTVVANSAGIVYVNKSREALQLVNPCSGKVVLSVPLGRDVLELLASD